MYIMHIHMTSVKNLLLRNFLLCYLSFFSSAPTKALDCSDLLQSGRFRKVSGSLSGSLHIISNLVAVPEDSGRFQKGSVKVPGGFWKVPEGSRRFRKGSGKIPGRFRESS